MATSELSPLSGPVSRALARAAERSPSLLQPVWREVVGTLIASHSRLVSFAGGVVTVRVGAGLASELDSQRPEICRRLAGHLGRRVELVIEGGPA